VFLLVGVVEYVTKREMEYRESTCSCEGVEFVDEGDIGSICWLAV